MHQIPNHKYEFQQDHRVVRLLVEVIISALCCQKNVAFALRQLLQEQHLQLFRCLESHRFYNNPAKHNS